MDFAAAIYVDTHCHLDLYKTAADVVEEAARSSVVIVGVTNTPSVFHYTENLAKKHNNVIPAVGLHPELVMQRKKELPQMWEILKRIRFVGEVGLDYVTTDQNERKVQREVFSQIIQHCSGSPNKILTIHSRRSAADVIAIIGNSFPGKVILHWFSGSESQAEKALSHGYYFSVNMSMLKSQKGQTLVKSLPKERILTETDGPFVSIDNGPIQPSDIQKTVAVMAKLLMLEEGELRQQIWENFQSLMLI
jgi:TatD DNase family protein